MLPLVDAVIENASVPIVDNVYGITTSLRELHPLKHSVPIEVNPFGRTKLDSELHPLKAESPIDDMDGPRLIDDNFVHFNNEL